MAPVIIREHTRPACFGDTAANGLPTQVIPQLVSQLVGRAEEHRFAVFLKELLMVRGALREQHRAGGWRLERSSRERIGAELREQTHANPPAGQRRRKGVSPDRFRGNALPRRPTPGNPFPPGTVNAEVFRY